ncbi:hypothetical protein FMN50_14750 [Rhodobacterales bacterium]|nr:hypothetical protein FMN50_14750 [Rhodobacterales bacterium]
MALTSDRFKNNARLQAAARNSPYMKWGERGEAVAMVQQAYVDLDFNLPNSKGPGGFMDGIFGQETYAVTRQFQAEQNDCGVDGIVGKDTLHRLDEIFRKMPGGAQPVAPLPPGPHAPRFEPTEKLKGFDDTVNPRWQMVPLNGERRVRLMHGAGLTVVSANTGVATVHEVRKPFGHGGREFIIKGHTKSTVQIIAKRGASVAAQLDVAVKSKKTVTITFNYVSDSAGHKTRRRPGELQPTFDDAKKIFKDQINVEIVKRIVNPAYKVAGNFGSIVKWTGVPGTDEWSRIIANRDASSDLNVFFVWRYEQDEKKGDGADAGTAGGNCLLEDDLAWPFWHVLAHEIGHHLGVGAHTANARDLMVGGQGAGAFIPKAHANVMNP